MGMMRWTAPSPDTRRASVTIVGSTGSVGQSTADLIARRPTAIASRRWSPAIRSRRWPSRRAGSRRRMAVVANPQRYRALKDALAGTSIEAAAGPDAVIEAASRPAEWVMAAVVGYRRPGADPGGRAARCHGRRWPTRRRWSAPAGLLIDAITDRAACCCRSIRSTTPSSRCSTRNQRTSIDRLILTASGGPFRNWSLADMAEATPEQALAHPNWDMGAKISIDSATMMNKGLELIEAHLLFGLPTEQIEIVVHPQSVIHSMVAYRDGSVLAQLGTPDMRVPIAHALGWPSRIDGPAARLDFTNLAPLTFERPDSGRFPSLRLAREALALGGFAPVVLNAANEVAVAAFLARRIGFLDIARVVENVMAASADLAGPVDSLQQIQAADREARRQGRRGCQESHAN